MANLKRGQPFNYFVSQKSFDTALARNLSSVYESEDSKGEERGNKVQVLLYHWYHHTHVCVCRSRMAHSERVYPVGLFRVALVVITSALFTVKLIFHSYQRCSSDLLNLLKSA